MPNISSICRKLLHLNSSGESKVDQLARDILTRSDPDISSIRKLDLLYRNAKNKYKNNRSSLNGQELAKIRHTLVETRRKFPLQFTQAVQSGTWLDTEGVLNAMHKNIHQSKDCSKLYVNELTYMIENDNEVRDFASIELFRRLYCEKERAEAAIQIHRLYSDAIGFNHSEIAGSMERAVMQVLKENDPHLSTFCGIHLSTYIIAQMISSYLPQGIPLDKNISKFLIQDTKKNPFSEMTFVEIANKDKLDILYENLEGFDEGKYLNTRNFQVRHFEPKDDQPEGEEIEEMGEEYEEGGFEYEEGRQEIL